LHRNVSTPSKKPSWSFTGFIASCSRPTSANQLAQELTMPCTISPHLQISPGSHADFAALAPFHYRSHHAGGITRIFTARYQPPTTNLPFDTPAAVLTMSLPALACTLRNIATHDRYKIKNRSLAAALLNKEVRTISRVIVHPLFRSLGLARQLVSHALAHADTPITEALAAMGRVHPFFAQAGMTAYDRPPDARTARLIAALDNLHLTPLDLCSTARLQSLLTTAPQDQRTFLTQELHRYAGATLTKHRAAHERPDILTTLITHARQHLLSQPIYYINKC
jgi:GNAT superfamily N-acetyltransferase